MKFSQISRKLWRYIARLTIPFFALVLITSVSLLIPQSTGIVTTDNTDAQSLVTSLLKPGGGITTFNEELKFGGGDDLMGGPFGYSAGTFTGGTGIVGFESGIILSSGAIVYAQGPNDLDDTSVDIWDWSSGDPDLGDPDLTELVGWETYNATVLEFDFTVDPIFDKVIFRYVFSSEEYNEYVCSEYNDVFAFFVNGINFALIPGTTTPVAINNVNIGNTDGWYTQDPENPELPCTEKNPTYFRNNDPSFFTPDLPPINIEPDGLTIVLEFEAPVIKGEINHIKLAIADTSDAVFDSWVFIEAESFTGAISGDAAFDVKPGSCPNPLNVDSNGVFPAAILGTSEIDVYGINLESIRLLDVGIDVMPLRSNYEDVATPHYPGDDLDRNDCTEDGPDGYLDLTVKFDTQQVVQALETWLNRPLEDGEVVKMPIIFEMANGDKYSGEDVVWIKKKKKKKK